MSPEPRKLVDLSAPKRELLARLLEKEPGASPLRTEAASPDADAGALAFAQERLWFLARLDPGLPAYNAVRGWRLKGPLDRDALVRSLAAVIARHEILSATFPDIDGRPIQQMRPTPLDVAFVDFSTLDDAQRETTALQLVADAARRPFDLAHGPLFRASLLEFGKRDHILLLTTHHLVFDGWSTTVLVRDLGMLYDALSAGRPANLPDVPMRYADFVRLERQRFGTEPPASLQYWKDRLAGIPEVMSLPIDRPRPPILSSRGGRHTVVLPPTLIDDLTTLGRRQGATLFMTMLAAFVALLTRCTGEDDIVVGIPIANRPMAELERVVGRFANILPLRVQLPGDSSFIELVARAKESALGAYAHQDLPFEKLVDELRPRRAPNYSPIVQVAFGLQSPSLLALSGLTATPLDIFNGHAKFDLNLTLTDNPDRFTASFEFKADLFDAETVAGMAGDFQNILDAVARNPAQRLSALPPPAVARNPAAAEPLGPATAAPDEAHGSGPGLAVGSLEAELAGIWRQVLGVERVGAHDNFFDLGGNSLQAVLLAARIEKRCGIEVTPAVLFETPTVARLARRLREKGGAPTWSTLVAIQPNGGRAPLFCVHGAGGHVLGYADLARRLGPDQPVYGLQAVGLDGGRAPEKNLNAMAAHYVAEIRRVQPRGPYHVCGLSFGGVVAFEMARQIVDQGEPAGLVALLDTSRPGHWTSLSTQRRLSNYARRARYHAGQLVWGPARLNYIAKKLRTARRKSREKIWRLAYLPYKISGRTIPRVLHHVYSSNRAALKAYTPGPYAGSVTLFVASERAIELHRARDFGWTEYALGGVDVHTVPGDHVSLIVEPAVGVLAEELRRCLDRARGSQSAARETQKTATT